MRLTVFFITLCSVLLFGCSKNIHSVKIEKLEKRIEKLENIHRSIEQLGNIQQTIPIIEAIPITIQNVERIDQRLIELSNDLKNHHHKSSQTP
jgi:hypothetical protein